MILCVPSLTRADDATDKDSSDKDSTEKDSTEKDSSDKDSSDEDSSTSDEADKGPAISSPTTPNEKYAVRATKSSLFGMVYVCLYIYVYIYMYTYSQKESGVKRGMGSRPPAVDWRLWLILWIL